MKTTTYISTIALILPLICCGAEENISEQGSARHTTAATVENVGFLIRRHLTDGLDDIHMPYYVNGETVTFSIDKDIPRPNSKIDFFIRCDEKGNYLSILASLDYRIPEEQRADLYAKINSINSEQFHLGSVSVNAEGQLCEKYLICTVNGAINSAAILNAIYSMSQTLINAHAELLPTGEENR